jgi:ATP-dependent HslUV protease subunit HslV
MWHATTIIAVRKNGKVAIAGDGQVSLGHTVIKATANKIRKINEGKILAGFAGSTADAFNLFEKLEAKLEKHNNQLLRASVEMAKDWRSDKYLRKLEAMLIVADQNLTLILSGQGDVLEPEDSIAAIGSGGNYARAAAKAFLSADSGLTAREIAERSIKIAADICVYTNNNIKIEEL